MESLFPIVPGASRPIPGEPSSSMTPGLAAMSPPATKAAVSPPLYGVLEVPSSVEEGPANGLTLDQAIERLVQENPDLRTALSGIA